MILFVRRGGSMVPGLMPKINITGNKSRRAALRRPLCIAAGASSP